MKYKKIIIIILLVYSVIHFIYSGIYVPLNKEIEDKPSKLLWNQILSLRVGILSDKSIQIIDPRQYGPIVFFVFHPVIKYERIYIFYYALIIDIIFAIATIYILIKITRMFTKNKIFTYIILILILNFSPFLTNIAAQLVDTWETFLISMASYFFIRNNEKNIGVLIGIASLIKLLPLIFLYYFLLKNKRIFVYSIITIFLILLVSNFLYVPEIGIKYFYYISKDANKLNPTGVYTFDNTAFIEIFDRFITNFNFKADIYDKNILILRKIIYFTIVIISLFIMIKFISNNNDKINKLLEISLILSFIPIISPNFGGHSLATLLIPAYIFIFITLIKLDFPLKESFIYFLSYFLSGLFFPVKIVQHIIPLNFINSILDNNNLTFIESYTHYLVPLIGNILLLIICIRIILIYRVKIFIPLRI